MQDSAFKPYKSSADAQTMVQDRQSPSDTETVQDAHVGSSPPSPLKPTVRSSPQLKAFDYTVEKLLKSSSSRVLSSASAADALGVSTPSSSSLLGIARWNGIPLEVIARHLWWQHQQHKSVTGTPAAEISATREVTSSSFASVATSSSTMCEFLANHALCLRFPAYLSLVSP